MMNEKIAPTPALHDTEPRRISHRRINLDRDIDDRDETIRMLNEALSEALTELELSAPKAA